MLSELCCFGFDPLNDMPLFFSAEIVNERCIMLHCVSQYKKKLNCTFTFGCTCISDAHAGFGIFFRLRTQRRPRYYTAKRSFFNLLFLQLCGSSPLLLRFLIKAAAASRRTQRRRPQNHEQLGCLLANFWADCKARSGTRQCFSFLYTLLSDQDCGQAAPSSICCT